jgi:hypothetical protein
MHPATQRATTSCTFAAAAAQENIPFHELFNVLLLLLLEQNADHCFFLQFLHLPSHHPNFAMMVWILPDKYFLYCKWSFKFLATLCRETMLGISEEILILLQSLRVFICNKTHHPTLLDYKGLAHSSYASNMQ